MIARRISRTSPEKAFVVVRNISLTAMTVGHGVAYDYATFSGTLASTPVRNDYEVTWNGTPGPTRAWYSMHCVAGVVTGNPIQPGAWGLVQNHGPVHELRAFDNLGWAFANQTRVMTRVNWLAYNTGSQTIGQWLRLPWVSSWAQDMSFMHRWFAAGGFGVKMLGYVWYSTLPYYIKTGYVSGYIRNL